MLLLSVELSSELVGVVPGILFPGSSIALLSAIGRLAVGSKSLGSSLARLGAGVCSFIPLELFVPELKYTPFVEYVDGSMKGSFFLSTLDRLKVGIGEGSEELIV